VSGTRRLVIVAIVALLALSAVLRFWHLDRPSDYVFDEVYYAKDAKAIVDGRVGPDEKQLRWEAGDEVSWPHAEAGKFAIALGILLAGDRPIAWRLAPAIAGLALLCCVYPLARRLGLPPPWALAALLLAVADPLNLVQSRIATLDVFVALWTTVCILLALRYADERRPLWLLLCGLAGGLALATKWSGALALVAAAVILVLRRPDEKSQHNDESRSGEESRTDEKSRYGDESRPGWSAIVLSVLFAVLCLAAVPLCMYLASYGQYFLSGHTWSDWLELQRQMWHFNLNLSAPHSYASAPVTWIADYRPVWYYFVDAKGMYKGVVAMGNPFLWWTAMAALVMVPLACLGRRRADGALLTAVLVAILYLPWMATSRTSFLYYMAPVAPLLAILVVHALRLLSGPACQSGRRAWRDVAALAVGFVLAAFLWDPIARVCETIFWRLPGRHPIARVCETIFWRLPGRLGDGVAFATAVTAGALAAAVLLLILTRSRPGVRAAASWLWMGAIAGIFLAFLPILVASPIPADDFYRLIWFPSWI
jgi:dolichyl-phosphate-mannose-protein mannosyltransferase